MNSSASETLMMVKSLSEADIRREFEDRLDILQYFKTTQRQKLMQIQEYVSFYPQGNSNPCYFREREMS
jgi:hypothetical protein